MAEGFSSVFQTIASITKCCNKKMPYKWEIIFHINNNGGGGGGWIIKKHFYITGALLYDGGVHTHLFKFKLLITHKLNFELCKNTMNIKNELLKM